MRLGLPLRAAIVGSRERFEVGEWKEDLEFWLDPSAEADAPELTRDTFTRTRVAPRPKRPAPPPPRAVPLDALDEDSCADLAVTGMRIVIRDGNSATVQFTVANLGAGALSTADLPETLPLDVFLGGAAEISGSSRLVTQVDLAERLRRRPGGRLDGGAAVTLLEEVDVRSVTRYTSVLTARIDGGQALRECDETNNEASVVLEE